MTGDRHAPLSGLRVLDFTGAAAGPFGASLLATLGADVIKVDSGGSGDVMLVRPPTQNGAPVGYGFYNRGKRSITLDLRDEADRTFMYTLADEADVVLDSKRPGVARRLGYDYETLAARNPRLIHLTLTAWGDSGELAGLAGSAPLAEWYSGWTSLQGAEEDPGEMDRFGALIDHAVSLVIVDAVLLALAGRATSGEGTRVNISLLETALWMQNTRRAEYLGGNPPRRLGSASGVVAPEQAFACADGRYLAVAAVRPEQWTRLCSAIGQPDLGLDPRFRTNSDRVRHRAELARILADTFATAPLDWWDIVLTRARVPHSRFFDWPTLRDHFAVRETGMLTLRPLGRAGSVFAPDAPWTLSESRLVEVDAVSPGQHAERIRAERWGPAEPAFATMARIAARDGDGDGGGADDGAPLSGTVVVDLSQGVCGPLTARLLAEAGAQVTKIEPPGRDYLRGWGRTPESDGRLLFETANRGKHVVTLDPGDPADRERLRTLLAGADVLITDGAPEDRDTFGLSADALRRDYPDLVHAIVRFCRDERILPDDLGSELIVQALTETCAGLGEPGSAPVRNGVDVAATCTALAAMGGILAALVARARDDGGGQQVHVDQVTAVLCARATVFATRTMPDTWSGWGPRLFGPPERGYQARGGRVVYPFLFRGQAGPFAELLRALGMGAHVDDPRFGEGGRHALGTGRYAMELRPLWEAAFESWEISDLRALFLRHGIVMVPANTYDDLYGPSGLFAPDAGEELPPAPSPWRLGGHAALDAGQPDPASVNA